MTEPNAAEPLKVGAWVSIRDSGLRRGPIVEFRGPLGPAGVWIYRIRLRRKPRPTYAEFREDQLDILPTEKDRAAGMPETTSLASSPCESIPTRVLAPRLR